MTCANCGSESPDGFRFCGSCGAALAAPAPSRDERKVVTVLFADLVGFTSRSEQLDPEDVRATLPPYYVAAAQRARALRRHRREVHRRRRDGALRRAGRPRGRSGARRARGARDPRGDRELTETDPALELHVRIAVTTGEALIALGARPAEGEGMAAGDVVNTAARLQAAAPVDGVLVGEATYRATRHVDRVPPGGAGHGEGQERAGRGLGGARRRARGSASTLEQRARSPLVGRERELGILLERARPRAPRASSRSSSRSSACPGSARAASSPSSGGRRQDEPS